MAREQLMVIADRFEVERLVARGGMGSVYRAFDREEQRIVALKLMDGDAGDGLDVERFLREADTLARVQHPRVVPYLGKGRTTEGRPYLVMPWLDGEDLRGRLDRGLLSLRDALDVIRRAAEAVAAVHAHGIVHRDLKPANFFLPGGSIQHLTLLDFGIARRFATRSRLTLSGAILGTPQYMAPEQAGNGQAIVPASDVYALGVIFYECLAGRPPFDAPHIAGVLARILFDVEEPIQVLRPGVPGPWAALLTRMLDKTPAHRPQSAEALGVELAKLPLAVLEEGTTAVAWSPSAPSTHAAPATPEQMLACALLLALPQAPGEEGSSQAGSGSSTPGHKVESALLRFGFHVESIAGSTLLAILSSGNVATDLARTAARAALHVREVWPTARIALATGRALVDLRHPVGEAVDRAALLLERATSQAAIDLPAEGWIRIDPLTAGLLDARFLIATEGDTAILLGERSDLDESRLLLGRPTPCVGREIELTQLEGLMTRAVDDAIAQAALIVAAPGTGKSRVRHELLRRLRSTHPQAEIVIGHGDPVTAGSPYGILSGALRGLAGIRAGDAPEQARTRLVAQLCRHVAAPDTGRIADFLGELCGVCSPDEDNPPLRAARSDPHLMSEQITQAFLDWLVAECAHHPIVLVLEDLQWGDAMTVKLVETSLRDGGDLPLLVLALARPEVKTAFPDLLSKRALELTLQPLSRRASEALIREVLGATVDASTIARLSDLAGGNALFLEELIRTEAEGKSGVVPETVLAMLQARIGRLCLTSRRLLRAASIFGEAFWAEPVQRVCEAWGAPEDVSPLLPQLVDAEFIQRRRKSRFPDELEYGFRHALVRDAAYSLLTDTDRRTGHVFVGHWLEAMGDSDAMEIAGHAHEGGEPTRALTFHLRAAEQSLDRNDLGEAFARATKGLDDGAQGLELGILHGIQAIALHGLGDWPRCASVGLTALELLPTGSAWWCRTAEKLLHVLPQVGQLRRSAALSDDLLLLTPAPDARAAHLVALCQLVGSFTVVGARAKAQHCLARLNGTEREFFDGNPHVRGMALHWHAFFITVLDADPWRAKELTEQSESAFLDIQAPHHLSFVRTLGGFARAVLADLAGAEQACRSALALAERLGDGYLLANAQFYLAYALSETSTRENLIEATTLAQRVLDADVSPTYELSARWALARIALAQAQWASAEAEAGRARALSHEVPIYRLATSTCSIQALLGQRRIEEAVTIVNEELKRVRRLGAAGFAEIPFLAAAADALLLAGKRDASRTCLQDAAAAIALRAGRIPDEAAKHRYLHEERCNRGVLDACSRLV
ncbi:serine/threonine-protein kinase [Chondromyces crocatus]|uniref:Protein kinase n=1 Tax=Chondromyces crocatus TaxID=52 RepID=A0A0K1E930_CHOCO|nr:serine/threonine-protein kinase [Chondromyces crocatus]AKT37182.1 protein kinase [Chondromyces crocatus]